LDRQKKKYDGLTPAELAICESQERMAIVISPENWKKAQKIAKKYNLELTEVGLVTSSSEKTGKVRMFHGKNVILDIDRNFIDSAGAHRKQDEVQIELGNDDLFPTFGKDIKDAIQRFLKNLERKEVALS
jgi:phosphoribosylformylglycinamidine synthase